MIDIPAKPDEPAMASVEKRTIRKLVLRVIPIVLLMMFLAHLDRTNVAFAAKELEREFGFTATTFGTGVSLFFLTYVALAVPSTLLLRRNSARVWLSRILIVWGLVSVSNMLIQGEISFYALRLLLGATEAGFIPFVLAFMADWLPEQYRARMTGIFLLGVPLSGVVGAPLSGLILDHSHGFLGIAGWQWMFLGEGLPTIICGFVVMRILTDRPKDAPWLDADERDWLQGEIDAENAAKQTAYGKQSPMQLITNPAILLLGLCYAMTGFGTNGIAFFLPQIISEAGFDSNTTVGLLTAIPLLAGAVTMMVVSQIADRRGEYRWTAVIAFTASGIGFTLASLFLNSPVIALIGLTLASAGIWATLPLLLAMPMQILSGAAVATGIAILNALGNIGPLFGPVITGIARDQTGNYALSLLIFGGVIFLAAISLTLNRSYGNAVRKPDFPIP